MKPLALKEESTFLFMKHFTIIRPNNIKEEDFPAPAFVQKIVDTRSGVFIDVLCSAAFTVGAFLFYLQIGENVSIH